MEGLRKMVYKTVRGRTSWRSLPVLFFGPPSPQGRNNEIFLKGFHQNCFWLAPCLVYWSKLLLLDINICQVIFFFSFLSFCIFFLYGYHLIREDLHPWLKFDQFRTVFITFVLENETVFLLGLSLIHHDFFLSWIRCRKLYMESYELSKFSFFSVADFIMYCYTSKNRLKV